VTPDEGVMSDVERIKVRRQGEIISVWKWSPRIEGDYTPPLPISTHACTVRTAVTIAKLGGFPGKHSKHRVACRDAVRGTPGTSLKIFRTA